MGITGQKVTHKVWGDGEITAFSQNGSHRYITVKFAVGDKEFEFPACFEKFLSAEDAAFKSFAEEEIRAAKEQEEQRRLQLEIEREKRFACNEEARLSATKRVYPRKNVAFKCTYCDGGANSDVIGFCDVCSNDNIKKNILKDKHTWCSTESYCKAYLEGKLTREQLQAKFDTDNSAVCYESNLLRAWRYEAGFVVNGVNKGKPKTLKQIQNNSLCVLTTQKSNSNSEERQIFGVFIVSRSEEGDALTAGCVEAHSKYRLVL
ncbi:MAG: hypothetical protein K2N68_04415, partial [Clostridia bacterium]|nr:hypothetical protein [Clostridia bacterium]